MNITKDVIIETLKAINKLWEDANREEYPSVRAVSSRLGATNLFYRLKTMEEMGFMRFSERSGRLVWAMPPEQAEEEMRNVHISKSKEKAMWTVPGKKSNSKTPKNGA